MDDLRALHRRRPGRRREGLLASDATYDDGRQVRPVRARDVAVIVESHRDARACRDALAEAGVPAVYTGDTDVFASQAAADWQCLLEAFEQPGRAGLVRAAAVTMFFGRTAAELGDGDDRPHRRGRRDRPPLGRPRPGARDRGRPRGGVRRRHGRAGPRLAGRRAPPHRRRAPRPSCCTRSRTATGSGCPRCSQWLRNQREERAGAAERNRRLDSDAAAVQIMTVWVSKGLQYPLVYLPFAFNRNVRMGEAVLYHEPDGTRCLDIGGSGGPGYAAVDRQGPGGDGRRRHPADLRRADPRAVAGRRLVGAVVGRGQRRAVAAAARAGARPGRGARLAAGQGRRRRGRSTTCASGRRPAARAWSAPSRRPTCPSRRAPRPPRRPRRPALRPGHRRRLAPYVLLGADPRRRGDRRRDVRARAVSARRRAGRRAGRRGRGRPEPLPDEAAALPSPMADLPSGAAFGSLVHGVLELADPFAPDLEAELRGHVDEQRVWWPVDTPTDELAAALVPLHHTSLGPLAGGLTLGELGAAPTGCASSTSRSRWPGRRRAGRASRSAWPTWARCCARHLADDDPLAPYAARLRTPRPGRPVAARLPVRLDRRGAAGARPTTAGRASSSSTTRPTGSGRADAPLTAAAYSRDRLAEAMLHSDYPLQALLYVVVVHRYLRWRQPGYDPARHLGGVLYLYVRGMCGPDTPSDDGHPAGVFSLAAAGRAGHRALRPPGRSPDDPARTPRDRGPARPAAGARAPTGCCATFNEAGVLDAADVHVAQRLCALAEDDDDAGRAGGGVRRCGRSAAARSASTWPASAEDAADERCRGRTPARGTPPSPPARWSPPTPPVLRLLDHDGVRLLYLDRYWREEEQVHADLVGRPAGADAPDEAWLAAALDRVFPAAGYDEQRAAARVALTHATTVLTGGPGTGKTTTVAALLALLRRAGRARRRAAAPDRARRADRQGRGPAPAGRRGARSPSCPTADRARLAGVRAVTLHRLLGRGRTPRPGSATTATTGCPHDVVVVDETSMVSLTMMARLLEAVRSGQPADPGRRPVPARLGRGRSRARRPGRDAVQETTESASRRSSPRTGSASRSARWPRPSAAATPTGPSTLLEAGGEHVELRRTATTPPPASARWWRRTPLAVLRAAEAGDADRALELLDRQRLLCAHREGPYGVRHWNTQVERWLGEETGEPIWSTWYAGRPLLVTANDYGLGIYNGDVGVAVRPAAGRPRAARRDRRQRRPARPGHQPARRRSRPCTR